MPVPGLSVFLTPGAGQTPIDLSPILSQETGASLSMLIEDPTGTNSFTTGDVTLKGYDVPGGVTVRNYFAAMTPVSMDYLVTIVLGLVPPGGSAQVQDVVFNGYVAQNTVQFEPRTGAFSFTVIGSAKKLQTTSAADLFQRPGYSDGKWRLYDQASAIDKLHPTLKISTTVPTVTPDIVTGDQIQFGEGEKFTVLAVMPDSATSPPAFWTLSINAPVSRNYGAGEVVYLLTKYQRSVDFETLVTGLFNAAGFPVKQYFSSPALPNLISLFGSPMNTTGLPGGVGGGIASAVDSGGLWIAISNASGVFYATSPTSGFTLYSSSAGFRQPPIDATLYQTATTMFGERRSRSVISNPKYGLHVTMKFYGYDHLAGNKRYVLTVTCDADVEAGTPFAIATKLESETCTAGVWVWGGTSLIGGIGITTTTWTDLDALYDAIGIDVDPATGTVFFTDIQLTGAAGSAITMNTSSYQPGGAGYVPSRVAGVNGPIVMTAPGRCVVFQVDGTLGTAAQAYLFTLDAAGVMTSVWVSAISPYVVGTSLKKNAGDGRFYVLISDPTQGILIQSFSSDLLIADPTNPASQIAPPPPTPTQSSPFTTQPPFDVDLVVQYGVSNGAGIPCPMFALLGGTPLYVSNTSSGYIAYADLAGLSVADALQQLSVVNAGIYYLSMNDHWNFRSRAFPMPGNPIGADDQIDGDSGCINVTTQQVYNKWVGYVSAQHDSDETIFGDTSNIPGSIAYANAEGLNLQLKSRFLSSASFASAVAHSLYNYLGTQKRWVEVNRFRDGRVYEIGRTFHCNVDGSNREFQIIEAETPITSVTVKVVGLEV